MKSKKSFALSLFLFCLVAGFNCFAYKYNLSLVNEAPGKAVTIVTDGLTKGIMSCGSTVLLPNVPFTLLPAGQVTHCLAKGSHFKRYFHLYINGGEEQAYFKLKEINPGTFNDEFKLKVESETPNYFNKKHTGGLSGEGQIKIYGTPHPS